MNMTLYDWFIIIVAMPFTALGLLALLILWLSVFWIIYTDFKNNRGKGF